jgi:hypothetical protein
VDYKTFESSMERIEKLLRVPWWGLKNFWKFDGVD